MSAVPLISVIVPVYNVAPYLRDCLDSVLRQKFGDFELICVDDGSTDGSSVILGEYAEKDMRVHIVRRANGGLSAARNSGLEVAVGEYVYFLDGDDSIVPDALAQRVRHSGAFIPHPAAGAGLSPTPSCQIPESVL